jgi:predicted nucleotide-binding protein
VLPEELTKQDVKDFRVPSDLAGVTPLEYEVRTDGNWEAAVGTACDDIEKRIDELGCFKR